MDFREPAEPARGPIRSAIVLDLGLTYHTPILSSSRKKKKGAATISTDRTLTRPTQHRPKRYRAEYAKQRPSAALLLSVTPPPEIASHATFYPAHPTRYV